MLLAGLSKFVFFYPDRMYIVGEKKETLHIKKDDIHVDI